VKAWEKTMGRDEAMRGSLGRGQMYSTVRYSTVMGNGQPGCSCLPPGLGTQQQRNNNNNNNSNSNGRSPFRTGTAADGCWALSTMAQSAALAAAITCMERARRCSHRRRWCSYNYPLAGTTLFPLCVEASF